MRRSTRAGIVLAAGLGWPPGIVAATPAGDRATLELRVLTYASLNPADVDLARATATALLATGGVQVVWRECSGSGCPLPMEGAPVLVVRLLPVAKQSDPTVAGEVIREPGTNEPSVNVYVPRIVEVTQAIRRSRAGRAAPELSTLTAGHVAGLAIAHEVGHATGLGHSASGPMRGQAGPEEFIALRRSMLHFPPLTLDRLPDSQPTIWAIVSGWVRMVMRSRAFAM